MILIKRFSFKLVFEKKLDIYINYPEYFYQKYNSNDRIK